MSEQELHSLFEQTSFYQDPPVWDDTKEYDDDPDYVYTREGANLGASGIQLACTYENSNEDCMFLERLVSLYRDGKLKVRS